VTLHPLDPEARMKALAAFGKVINEPRDGSTEFSLLRRS
jgi:hypothetical protein